MSFGPYTKLMNRCGYYADKVTPPTVGAPMVTPPTVGAPMVPIIEVEPGDTDYIDLIEEKDMGGHSVVVYTDKFRRPGFALLVEDKVTERQKGLHCKKGLTNVLAPFQRYTDSPDTWRYGWGDSNDRMESNLQTYWANKHGEDPDSILWKNEKVSPAFYNGNINNDLLEEIVSGKNPYVCLKYKI